MTRKKPSNIKASGIPERIARTDAKGKQTQLETRLGRLVLKLARERTDAAVMHLVWYPGLKEWAVLIDVPNGANYYRANPIDALLAAGITDE